MLLKGGQYEEEELVQVVKEHEIIDLFSTILNSNYATQVATEYIVTALTKLTTRLSDPAQIERIRRLLQQNATSLDVEVQQRAVEYGNLFAYDQIRRGVLEKMPPPQIKEESRMLGETTKKPAKSAKGGKPKVTKPKEEDLLFDLMGDGSPPPTGPVNGNANNTDLLADILGGATSSPPPATSSPPPGSSNVASIMDLFSSGSPAPTAPAAAPITSNLDLFSPVSSPPPQTAGQPAAAAGHPCYNKNGLNVTIQTQRNAEGMIQAVARFKNSSGGTLSDVGLQAAVPKSQKLQLLGISSTDIGPGAEATQMMRVTGCKGVSCRHFHKSHFIKTSLLDVVC
jgi:AP-1 complex subunit gamma-1